MIFLAAYLCCSLLKATQAGAGDFWPSYQSNSKLEKYRNAAVSTDAAPCAPIGKDILKRNGSAVDAAIAVLVCMGAHNPHSMGLGGGFLMMYYNRTERRAYYLDSREVAPRKSTVDMFQGNSSMASEGGLSIAVPGELAGYQEAYRRFGSLPWQDLFSRTIEMCRKGIAVSEHLASAIALNRDTLMRHETIRSVFFKNGTHAYEAGEHIQMPKLAQTLEVISRQGMIALYGGSKLAKSFLADLKAAGSIIDQIDLQSYRPRMRNPAQVSLRENTTLYSSSIPGSGAILAFMLSVLDGYAEAKESLPYNEQMASQFYHRMVETFKYGYAHRSRLEDSDSQEIIELLSNLTSRTYADYIRTRINDSATYEDPSHYEGQWGFREDHGTAHVSLVAPDGDAVSVTSTINQLFGSKVMSPSTGIILNDQMDDFSSPSITNYFGLSPSTRNRIRPGKSPLSSMSPSILVDGDGNVKLVLGGNGGTMITTSVLQVAARVLFLGEDIKSSIDAPRIHHQLIPNVLRHEANFPQTMVENLQKFGHIPKEFSDRMKSVVMGIHRDQDGYLYANSDYRKGGDVEGF